MSESEEVPSLVEIPSGLQRLVIAYYKAGTWITASSSAAAPPKPATKLNGPAFAAQVGDSGARPYDELCEERGEAGRAVRHRRLLQERGIDP